jgi:hypothetical protein
MCWHRLQIKWDYRKNITWRTQEIEIKILADLHSSGLLITDFLCNSLLDLEDGCEASFSNFDGIAIKKTYNFGVVVTAPCILNCRELMS